MWRILKTIKFVFSSYAAIYLILINILLGLLAPALGGSQYITLLRGALRINCIHPICKFLIIINALLWLDTFTKWDNFEIPEFCLIFWVFLILNEQIHLIQLDDKTIQIKKDFSEIWASKLLINSQAC